MVASALKWNGGYVWACKNYDGDVQSDIVAQGFGSLGLMTSVLMSPDGTDRGERGGARHGDAALSASTRRAARPAPTRSPPSSPGRAGSPIAAGSTTRPTVTRFAETLERVCIETVESGAMTKDLAVLIGPEQPWLNTQAFLAKIDENLRAAMATG